MKHKVMHIVLVTIITTMGIAAQAQARDLYVGGDGANRFPTIQAAISQAQPGDTIHLNPANSPYRELAVFNNISGTSDRPITLDGHGAVLLGCDPADPTQWERVGDGLWRSVALAEQLHVSRSMVSRFFFVFDGRPQYMGGAFKHQRPTLKQPAELGVHEWTYIELENAFYLRLASDAPFEQANIEIPVRANGVALRGSVSHVVVRNVKAKRVWNDGFNIHGQCSNIVFENIEAIECGDDGISAHGECEIAVYGLVARGNANGICHVHQSRTITHDVLIEDSRAHDLYLLNDSVHTLRDVTIESNGPRGVVMTSDVTAEFHNVVVGTSGSTNDFRIQQGARVSVADSRLEHSRIHVRDASVEMINVAVTGKGASLTVDQPRAWRMQGGVWDGQHLTYNGRTFDADDLAAFQAMIEADMKTISPQ